MKKRLIAVLIAGAALVPEVPAQGKNKDTLDVEQVMSITLYTRPTHWKGVFYSNGGAELKWREDLMGPEENFAVAPRGSFSFKEVYRLLSPYLNGNAADYTFDADLKARVTCWLGTTEETREIARKLMSALRDKAIPRDRKKFEELLREHPFVAGDKPVAHTYRRKRSDRAQRDVYYDVLNDVFKEVHEEWEKTILRNIEREKKMLEAIHNAEREAALIKGDALTEEEKRDSAESILRQYEVLGKNDVFTEEKMREIAERIAQQQAAPAAEEPQVAKTVGGGTAETPPPTFRRPWLYVGTLFLSRRKR